MNYTCPMHPEVRQEKSGMCPECGMSLVKTQNHAEHHAEQRGNGYDKHAGHSTQMFLRKFWVSLILTIPVVLYADVVGDIFKWSPPDFPGSHYLSLVLGSVVFFYGGWVFLAGAWREIQGRLPGMMTLIGIAVSAAYLWSVYAVFAGEEPLFWELTTLITIMLLGHWLEMRAVSGAQGALKELSKLLPDMAEVIRNGKTESLPLSQLREGDAVFVRPGGRIPSDGVVAEGRSEVNESMVTGESSPVAKTVKSEVIAGTVNGDGSLTITVTKVGELTFLAGVMRLVAQAQASKSRLQMLSDKAAFYLTVIAVAGGLATFTAWFATGHEVNFAMARLVAVLVIACPHALGLAVPLVASISTTLAARHGFLVKQRLALEAARNIDIVLFDKTGTLTKGEYGVTRAADQALLLAASVDAHSEHFVAQALVREAHKRNLALLQVADFARIPGRGVKGVINGIEVRVEGAESNSQETVVAVFQGNQEIGTIALADVIREESREAIHSLKTMGVKVAMITGDSAGVASWVAKELGIDEYFSKVLPGQKVEKVKLLQQKGLKVAMVGDGVNDAPALTQADLGIAIGAGTNVAVESAGIILLRNDPRDIVKIIWLSRATFAKMVQNLFWATGYNVIALPLAAGVLAFKGIVLEPALAAVLMSASTVIVAANAMLLRKKVL
ncbi:MAG: cadmium-translocating P-type ATPase [Candidatus Wildermuthbacteria bacterium]|nr:cadmium-translocating P-type ATPase [Candidatus Wildermuthbacteria bacterium]